MRVIVCGGRDFPWDKRSVVFNALSEVHAQTPIDILFHGNARGVDTLTGTWARSVGIKEIPVPANWTKYGKRAGPIRNKHMLGQSPDLVIAFPGGKGTAHMVSIAEAAGVPVRRITTPNTHGERDVR